MSTTAVEIKDHVIRNAEAKILQGKEEIIGLENRLAKAEAAAVTPTGLRSSFVDEVARRRVALDLKRMYLAELEKKLIHAIQDLPRRQGALKRSQDLKGESLEWQEKKAKVDEESQKMAGIIEDLAEASSEALANANMTLNEIQGRAADEIDFKKKNLEARVQMARSILTGCELTLKSAKESKVQIPEIIQDRERKVVAAQASLAKLLEDPET